MRKSLIVATTLCLLSGPAWARKSKTVEVTDADREAAVTAAKQTLESVIRLQSEGRWTEVMALHTEDCRIVGTDATEHWNRAQVEEVIASLEAAPFVWGWTLTDEHYFAGPNADVVWFAGQATIEDPPLGSIRTSGVLVVDTGQWKVAQLVLSFPVPNEKIGMYQEMLGVPAPDAPAEAAPEEAAPEGAGGE